MLRPREMLPAGGCPLNTRKVDVRLPGKGNSNSQYHRLEAVPWLISLHATLWNRSCVEVSEVEAAGDVACRGVSAQH